MRPLSSCILPSFLGDPHLFPSLRVCIMEIPSWTKMSHSSITHDGPPCMAHSSVMRHDVVTTPNLPTNPPNHLPLLSLTMHLYPANPEFCIKVPSVLILMYPDGGMTN
ncbi:hypothetical protein H5410_052068 [Solanum commersonii]|uniref:Uncharacterized protein n=1 Tax=Solanum commersonii TaxID=4109 RepID=A0A9J5WZU8_SOLCO|nr:hypothetical protein H5410_052068 [Solanum commersonii]